MSEYCGHSPTEVHCPICSKLVPTCDINEHVEVCMQAGTKVVEQNVLTNPGNTKATRNKLKLKKERHAPSDVQQGTHHF